MREREKLSLPTQEWIQPAWITSAGGHLPFEAEDWGAIAQLLGVFVSRGPEKLKLSLHEWVQEGWKTAGGGHLPFTEEQWGAIDQLLRVFRSLPREKLSLLAYEWIQVGWIKQVASPAFDPQLRPAIDQLLRAFRSDEPEKLIVTAHDWVQPAWITFAGGHFPFTEEQIAAIVQLFESFRTAKDPNSGIIIPGDAIFTIPEDVFEEILESFTGEKWKASVRRRMAHRARRRGR
jgi:hypothetical protein